MTGEGLWVVAGLGVSGTAAARALAAAGQSVMVVEGRDDERIRARAAELEASGGITVRVGDDKTLPDGARTIVTTGWRPDSPLLTAAADAEVEIVSEMELAWRLRPAGGGAGGGAEWLALTGTDGKTTTVRMLAAMLVAGGHKALAVGNVGTAAVEGVLGDADVLAVEMSSFQLHWSATLRPYAAAVLNVAPDHLDWHGTMEAYAAAKGKIFERAGVVIYNADDPGSVRLALSRKAAPTRRPARQTPPTALKGARHPQTVSFTLDVPRPGQLGVMEGLLVDRAFPGDPAQAPGRAGPVELASVADVRPYAPHNVANALAAAALARSYGLPAQAVRQGLRDFVPDPHRNTHVARIGGVDYIDDSKATNPHAAAASLAAYPSVVWVAGGLLKGLDVEELVREAASRLRGAVLIGADRARIREALARHAPDVRVVDLADTDTGVMDRVVTEAAGIARPGDTVLLAPAGASQDMFENYPARGHAFAAAVRLREAR